MINRKILIPLICIIIFLSCTPSQKNTNRSIATIDSTFEVRKNNDSLDIIKQKLDSLSSLYHPKMEIPDSLKVSTSKFNTLVNLYSSKIMSDDTLFNTKDYITMLRIFNTIRTNEGLVKQYENYYDLHRKKMFGKIIVELEMSIWPTKSFYSKKYNLFVGGISQHANSYYKIID